MLQNNFCSLEQINKFDYYSSRWNKDINKCLIYVGMVFVLILIGAWHDLLLFFTNNSVITFANMFVYIFRAIGLIMSLAILLWLMLHRDKPINKYYANYIFIWESIVVIMCFFSDINRPQTYYLSTVIELPIMISMYLIIPQYGRILRILPPAIFSMSLFLIYFFCKIPPNTFGFGSLYLGLLFVNLIGIYFSDKMYANDYRLFYLSNIDELTGLYNRRYLKQKLDEQWQQCLQQQKLLVAFLLDIDYFKSFNDTYGHQAGDDILRKVANDLSKNIKSLGAFVARYGGEEFVIIIPNSSIEKSKLLANTIRKSIEELKISHKNSNLSEWLTISIGISSAIPNNNIIPETLIHQADIALYQAKEQGRNQVVIYTQEFSELK